MFYTINLSYIEKGSKGIKYEQNVRIPPMVKLDAELTTWYPTLYSVFPFFTLTLEVPIIHQCITS